MSFLIIDVAGKWFSTTQNKYANCIVVNEIEAFDKLGNKIPMLVLDATQTGGNMPASTYWNDQYWNRSKLLDGNKDYNGGAVISVCSPAYEIDTYRRFVISIDKNLEDIIKLNAWVGGISTGGDSGMARSPKQISMYFCNSYDVNSNLKNRNDSGLELLNVKSIPKNLSTPTVFKFIDKDFINNFSFVI